MWNSVKRLFWQPEAVEQTPSSDGALVAANGASPALELLRDVEGVIGSLAAHPSGEILAADMPRLFDGDTVRQVATRIIQLHSAVTSDGGEFTTGTVQYQGYQLHVERIPSGLVGVLAHETLNRAALRMAIRAVGRRIEQVLVTANLWTG